MDLTSQQNQFLDALLEDSSVAVAVFAAEDLKAIRTNHAADCLLRHGASEPSLADFMTPAIAAERVEIARTVVAAGARTAVHGMVAGAWTRTVYRPVAAFGVAALLMIVEPVSEFCGDLGAPADRVVRASVDDLGKLSPLTEREIEVLRLIGLGLTTEDIAARLHRSAKTVQGHRLSLGLKLDINNRVELARIAIEAGITTLDGEEIVQVWRQAKAAD